MSSWRDFTPGDADAASLRGKVMRGYPPRGHPVRNWRLVLHHDPACAGVLIRGAGVGAVADGRQAQRDVIEGLCCPNQDSSPLQSAPASRSLPLFPLSSTPLLLHSSTPPLLHFSKHTPGHPNGGRHQRAARPCAEVLALSRLRSAVSPHDPFKRPAVDGAVAPLNPYSSASCGIVERNFPAGDHKSRATPRVARQNKQALAQGALS